MEAFTKHGGHSPARIFGAGSLARFLLAGESGLLLDIAGGIYVPHTAYNLDVCEEAAGGERPAPASALGELYRQICDARRSFEPGGERELVEEWSRRMCTLPALAREGRVIVVGGSAASPSDEVEEMLGETAGDRGGADPAGVVRLDMGIAEFQGGAMGVSDGEGRLTGPHEAHALTVGYSRGWQVVSDSPVLGAAADYLSVLGKGSPGLPAACATFATGAGLLEEAVSSGMVSESRALTAARSLQQSAREVGDVLGREI